MPRKKKAAETAIVPRAPETDTLAPGAVNSSIAVAIHSIQQSISRVETVRKYMQKNLNVGQRKLLKKIGKRQPTDAEAKQLKELEIDFGTIPGVRKPFLKQPGAEKIAQWLHVRPVYVSEVTPVPDHPGHIEVHGRCKLMLVGPGPDVEIFSGPLASCSTMETNYRYRWIPMDPPPTQDWIKNNYKLAKAMGTHKCFQADNKWIYQERRENPNIYDELNKVRQIGEKRMLVKAIRQFGALSEIFTEDPSEWDFEENSAAVEEPIQPGTVKREEAAAPVVEQPAEVKKTGTVEIRWPSDTSDVAFIYTQDADYAAKIRDFCEWKDAKSAWLCPGINVPDAVEIASRMGLATVETEEGKTEVRETPPKPVKADAPPAEPVAVTGKVAMVKKQPGQKGSFYYIVMLNNKALYCYRTGLYEHLAKALHQDCEFIIQPGTYPKIVSIKRVGETEFDDDVPVIQRGAQ